MKPNQIVAYLEDGQNPPLYRVVAVQEDNILISNGVSQSWEHRSLLARYCSLKQTIED
jgi:hypothetical protein